MAQHIDSLREIQHHDDLFQGRLDSFKNNWPHKRPSAQQIAEAGFIYLGPNDRVKCVKCNGILKNWDKDDDPITEHVEKFANCEYAKTIHKHILAQTTPPSPKNTTNRVESKAEDEVKTGCFCGAFRWRKSRGKVEREAGILEMFDSKDLKKKK